jgi:D-sedoheptulose 7-phosphate isomerase
MDGDGFVQRYLAEAKTIVERLDAAAIERVVDILAETRARGGRLFILGVGGSAANASHAAADFRKIVGIEAYAPTDNVSELTARFFPINSFLSRCAYSSGVDFRSLAMIMHK